MSLGNRIANLRNNHHPHMTQEEFAEKMGISRAALSHYEKDRRDPDYETLQKIADFFDVSTDYLLGRTENPNRVNYKKMNEEPEELVYNGQAIKLRELNTDQRILIDWALSHESLSFKDKPQDFFELLDLIRNIKPHIEELEKKKEK